MMEEAVAACMQIFVPSRDGVRIPLFITHKKGLVLDGSHPTLLYGKSAPPYSSHLPL